MELVREETRSELPKERERICIKKEQGDKEGKEEETTNKKTKPKIRVDTTLRNRICRIFNSIDEQPKWPEASEPSFQPV